MDSPRAAAGGNFPVGDVGRLTAELRQNHPFLTDFWAARLIRAYGTEAATMMQGARSAADLGRDFGQTLTEGEVRWLMDHEFARAADDIVWRRTKLGLRMTSAQIAALEDFMTAVAAPKGDTALPEMKVSHGT